MIDESISPMSKTQERIEMEEKSNGQVNVLFSTKYNLNMQKNIDCVCDTSARTLGKNGEDQLISTVWTN